MRYSDAVDELVFTWTEFQQLNFAILRGMILDSNPMVVESVKYNVPFYTLNGLLMYISPTKNGGLYLAFCQGDLMVDSYGLFSVPDTKNVRKVQFQFESKVNMDALHQYILEAVSINLRVKSFAKYKKPY